MGCKSDLQYKRDVSHEEAQQWCQENGLIPYFEVSSKDNANVQDLFKSIAKLSIKQVNSKKASKPGWAKLQKSKKREEAEERERRNTGPSGAQEKKKCNC